MLTVEQRKDLVKKILIWGGLGLVLAAVLMGRASWVMGVMAALIAIMARLTKLLAYFPTLKKVFPDMAQADASKKNTSLSQMSRQEAAEILGVDIDASVDDIRLAHKRLMQKIHPDRGGSEPLAKQINQAKDVLLS